MAFTEKKRRYVEARLSGLAMKAAAIFAGCPETTARQAATRLEKDPDVQAAMTRLAEPKCSGGKQQICLPPEPQTNPLAFFEAMMNDPREDSKIRLEAARSLAAYTLPKPGDLGKKEAKEVAAKKAGSGKFSAAPPPPTHLRSVK
ncbi:terminase small subunit [Pseudomonas lutea]|uniref:Terminase small subunit n=1 Tax=Pseudomonas lutea TaxID=243924 RepID=A0ABR9A8V1_9PSED|nr:terminase small subunit [Pseudomonas lutea]MBD8122550.1 terminase small subunit [Pseudomonas lutea]